MEITKESILRWLDKYYRPREWLAEQCNVSRRTVNNWLVSPRPIPKKALPIIASLMQADQDREYLYQSIPQTLNLEFSREEFAAICREAGPEGPNVWAEEQLRKLTSLNINEVASQLKKDKYRDPSKVDKET